MVKIHYAVILRNETKKLQKFINHLRSKKYNNTTPHIREIRFFDIAVNTEDVNPFERDLKELLGLEHYFSNLNQYKKMFQKISPYENIKDLEHKSNKNFRKELQEKQIRHGLGAILLGMKKDNYKNWSD